MHFLGREGANKVGYIYYFSVFRFRGANSLMKPFSMILVFHNAFRNLISIDKSALIENKEPMLFLGSQEGGREGDISCHFPHIFFTGEAEVIFSTEYLYSAPVLYIVSG